MTTVEVLDRLKTLQTMPELDAMRIECIRTGEADGRIETALMIQKAFIKAKNRLNRIPWIDRTW